MTTSPPLLDALLARTSRTFALTIPLLPEPLATEVGVAYLLYRLADTLEDADLWPRDERLAALASFESWVQGASASEATEWQRRAAATPPVSHAGYMDLVASADAVRARLGTFPAPAADAIRRGVARTTARMAGFVARQGERGEIALADVRDLQAYCYAVAGIVGEVLTELFVLAAPPLAEVRADLDADAARFGEGLQLVNILKDAPGDAAVGRVYLPRTVPRSEVFELARRDLARANAYVAALERGGAAPGMLAFCALPVALAEATLDALVRGEAKLARDAAGAIVARVVSRYSPSVRA